MSDEAASPRISIVVPVYKVEKYLRDCVESVLAQSFEDFELILVDDGSPDKCGEICDELAKKDSRIRVFHQANRGEALARGLGVEHARGEWINFVDSDDLVPKDALETLINEATDDVEWVQGGMQRFNDGETPKAEARTGRETSFDLVGLVENMLLFNPGAVAKIVRRKLFSPNVSDISRDIRIGPDTLMNLRLIANRPREAKEIDKVVYFYRQQAGSVLHTYLRSEGYILRHTRLILAEIQKISSPSDKERLSRVLSKKLYRSLVSLIAYGLPIKFPHRIATLIRPSAKSNLRCFFTYLCLSVGCPGLAIATAKVCHFLHGRKFDAKEKTLLE